MTPTVCYNLLSSSSPVKISLSVKVNKMSLTSVMHSAETLNTGRYLTGDLGKRADARTDGRKGFRVNGRTGVIPTESNVESNY